MLKNNVFKTCFPSSQIRLPLLVPLDLLPVIFPQSFIGSLNIVRKMCNIISDILRHEKSITIKAILDKNNTTKIIYHSVFLNHISSEEMWGPNFASTKMLPTSPVPYSYHDYLTAWFRFMLHQNENMSHSWFVNFDKDFNSKLPLWFSRWWT